MPLCAAMCRPLQGRHAKSPFLLTFGSDFEPWASRAIRLANAARTCDGLDGALRALRHIGRRFFRGGALSGAFPAPPLRGGD